MIPRPKFSIGDKVFRGSSAYCNTKITCPDCLGKKEWVCKTPAGEEFFVSCGTCESGWYCTGLVDNYAQRPLVSDLTIGSIQINTSDEHKVRYMCVETGVGSGSIYNESELFSCPKEALTFAEAEAVQRQEYLKKQEEVRVARQKKRVRRKPKKAGE